MSDGGFDVDELLKKRHASENLFVIVKDPKTGRFVSFPSVPKSDSLSIDSDIKTSKQNSDFRKGGYILPSKMDDSKKVGTYSNLNENDSSINNYSHKKNSIIKVKNKTAFEYCKKCKEAYRCKLGEHDFKELCPFNLSSNLKKSKIVKY